MRLSLQEGRSGVLRSLGQQNAPTIQNKELNEALNDAHRKLCQEFDLNRSSWSAAAVSDERIYAPPQLLSEIERIDFDDRQIEHVLLEEIYRFGEDVSVTTPVWTEDI